MPQPLELSLIRVFDMMKIPVGVGFLVGKNRALTCAHVVRKALGLKGFDDVPQGDILLDFPLLEGGKTIAGRVEVWDGKMDIAVLNLSDNPSADAKPARLVRKKNFQDHTFITFGFPRGHNDGVWVFDGRILKQVGSDKIQIECTTQTGYFIKPGFSGGAVWVEALDGVIGMIVEADLDPNVRSAFFLPVSKLVKFYPDLEEWIIAPTENESQLEGFQYVTALGGKRINSSPQTNEDIKYVNDISPKSKKPKIDSFKLFQDILKLDFLEQVDEVEKIIFDDDISAFLIHGKLEYGQRVLFRKLYDSIPRQESTKPIVIVLSSNLNTTTADRILQRIATDLPLGFDSLSTNIDQLCGQIWDALMNRWKTQNVVIVFDGVDQIDSATLKEVLNRFWYPLANKLKINMDARKIKDTKAILFLIDYKGCVREWGVCDIDANTYAIPRILPFIQPFSQEMIKDCWKYVDPLLRRLVKPEEIYSMSNQGIPLRIYEYICKSVEISWEGELIKWL
ncbi:MAG: trypsin-like peptidase domain-containing protein [Leptolinea sp.]